MTNQLLVDSATVSAAAPRSRGRGHRAWAKARQHPLGAIASVYLVLLVIAGLMAASLAPFDPAEQDLSNVLSGPTSEHWLGTDTLGRDLLSQLLYGIRPSLVGAVQALVVFLAVGVTIGIVAGYRGGRVDAIVGRTVDLAMSIPTIIMILVLRGVSRRIPGSILVLLLGSVAVLAAGLPIETIGTRFGGVPSFS